MTTNLLTENAPGFDTRITRSDLALRASEQRYRRLFEAAKDGILILDADTGRITDVNRFLVKLLGYSHSEIIGKTVGELSPFKDVVSNQVMLEQLQSSGYVRYEDLPLETKDGRKIAVEFVSNVYRAGDKQVIQCNIRDITERKRAEAALRASEERSRSLFANMLDGMAHCRMFFEQEQPRDFVYLEVNHAFEQLTGLKNVVGRAITELIPGIRESNPELFEIYGRVALTGQSEQFEIHLEQLNAWLAISAYSTQKECFVALFKNITERKRTEAALQESQRFLRATLDALSAHIVILDERGTIIAVNAAWQRFASENQLLGSAGRIGVNYLQVCDSAAGRFSEEARSAASGIRAIIEGQREMFALEYPCDSPQEKRWFILRVTRFGGDGPVRVVVTHENISERKKIEVRIRRLVDSNAQGVAFWNTKGQITEANAAYLNLTGYTRADLEAGPIDWVAMTPPEYADLDQHALKELAATGICTPFEKEYVRKDGSRIPILLGAAILEDKEDEGVCFVLDLTERNKLEHQLRQSQKMESIGTLAGGVAHDFNNLLAVIQMQTELMKFSGDLSAEQMECATEIEATVQRAATLTRQLLLFSRKEILHPRDLELNQSITSITNLLRRVLGEDIQMQFNLSAQPVFIRADAGMMDQVLLNLAVNCRDAMPKGGRLVVETSAVDFDEDVSSHSAQARPGAFVCLSVSDNGCGIPAENLPRIFEPFFTTKEVGKGTGLGLATLFGIIQQHKGWINVYSEVGHGTTFRIYLPRLERPPLSPQAPAQPELPARSSSNETILLVEDDDFLRPSLCQMLSRLGYRVLEARNGVEALAVWKEHRDEIRLVLTDMVMSGGTNGRELGERLLQENPKLKVIYASGYSREIVSQGSPLTEGVNFLTKPYQSQMLVKTIRERLNEQAREA